MEREELVEAIKQILEEAKQAGAQEVANDAEEILKFVDQYDEYDLSEEATKLEIDLEFQGE